MTAPLRRIAVRVEGIVQGVGFRPHVHALAVGLGLDGFVGNDPDGVFVELQGPAADVEAFLDGLARDAPVLALVEQVTVRDLDPMADVHGFTIVASTTGGRRRTLVSPDVATCDACLREVADPADRRYRYPFTNCTDCGPRFTIIRDVPYDRPATTMASFPLCEDCRREYEDPTDRRFHAQPVCCPVCGPELVFIDGGGRMRTDDPLGAAVGALQDGAIVAIKGLGGYHLAADARDDTAVAELRSRKHREEKPFAVLVADLDEASRWCELEPSSSGLLTDRARPIVLVPRRDDGLADAVAPGNSSLGLMLPYTPLHHLLAAGVGGPLVLTSGNVSDEPIAYEDHDALARLTPIADAFLTHDRPIHVRTDDSVARVVAGRPSLLRRSRGYAPGPVTMPITATRPVLAVGAELKSTVCVADGTRAFLSPHIGDLENHETYLAFRSTIDHLCRLFDVTPEVVAYDLHPEYLSTKHVEELPEELERVGVQHHHAHIASCLADNRQVGPVIGVAFDGTGYGTDGTLWGGEFLVADLADHERIGHLRPVPLPGGAAAIREPWRMTAAYLRAAGREGAVGLGTRTRNRERWELVQQLARAGPHAPLTSSAGRLFDAVAALLDVRDAITYEGQAAIELEQLAVGEVARGYPIDVSDGPPFVVDGPALVGHVLDDVAAGSPRGRVAARFHASVADAIVEVCTRIRVETSLDQVALSGGVFQNALLTSRSVSMLEQVGFEVLTHRQVPCNDGGISFGQAVVAAARGASGS